MSQPPAFSRLHPEIQRVLWDMKWETLRDLQVDAIHAWFDTQSDLILMANTASGKTEAAFLPILSSIAADSGAGSVRVLYIGPLKALINDQFRRAEDLCRRAEIPVHRWHGDVSADQKHDLLRSPSGVLLITPESLESLLMRRGREARRVLARLEAVVIDEMHSFVDSTRGRQLVTQIRRIDLLRGAAPAARRIGLSATINKEEGKLRAQRWLQRDGASLPVIVESAMPRDIELVVKTFLHEKPHPESPRKAEPGISAESGGTTPPGSEPDESAGLVSVADHVFENLRGSTNLVFCNRKSDIEVLADHLAELSDHAKVPREFLVHHGSLSKQIREDAESELKSGRPATAICSSTLEMGIDIGYVDSIGQVGPPPSVSALAQRLGRSGRRPGQPCRLWLYVPVLRAGAKDPLPGRLYPEVLQSVALVELLLEKWVEPPWTGTEDYSTLLQQTLSIIVERGGINARDAYRLLSGGPAFSSITPERFAQFLRDLGKADLVSQAADGDLILGLAGEKLTGHYDFFAAFETPDEYDVVEGSRHIGSLDVLPGLYDEGDNLILAGRRWNIVEIDHSRRVFLVRPARDRKPPMWSRGGGHIHRRVREKMRELLASESMPPYINTTSQEVMRWARAAAAEGGVGRTCWVDGYLFTWTGSREHLTLYLWLAAQGEAGMNHSIAIAMNADRERTRSLLERFMKNPPTGEDLTKMKFHEDIPSVGKHGPYLSRELRGRAYATANLDVPGAVACARSLLASSW